ncbi:MAG: hypothetical protein WBG53_15910 [Rhodococcus sp. (in: high G+C Gram-positive bacteria)]|uniref:hypothetical protein n=1 Tax=Rhodococcus sp. SBT000017 TaxID=1803385 RepID=UPI000EF909E8|nr:hypothetical protein [Rhodococcus sp. SBT000017]RMB72341.1 hypothetical protein AYK61_25160 [Rhodococcus sp. SBT000017]
MSAFVRAARFVGDLDDEFYADELQRDAWNEASAVGFQSLLWIGLIAGSVLPFTGVTGAWVALGIYLALITVSFVVLAYSRARGIDMYTSQELRRVRIGLAAVLLVLSGGGAMIRLLAHYGGGDLGSLWIGAAGGAALGFAAAIVGVKMHQRRQREAELAAEKAELQGFDEAD